MYRASCWIGTAIIFTSIKRNEDYLIERLNILRLSLHKRYIHDVVGVACCGWVELEDYINFVQNDPTFIPLLNLRTPFLALNSPSSTSRIHLGDTIIFISMVYANVALISTNMVFYWFKAKSGDITQNMILLFMIIPTEHFHASLSEPFDDRTENSCTASTSRYPIHNFPKALYGTTGGTCSARFFRPVIGVTPHQNIPWFKLSFLALDGFVQPVASNSTLYDGKRTQT